MQENRRARPSPAFGVSVADLGRFRSHDIEYFSERTMDLLDEANEALDVGEFDVGNAAMADALHLGLCAHDRRGYATEGHEDDTMPYHIRFAFDNYHVTRTMAQRKFRICYDWDSLMGRAYGIPLRLDIEVFTVFQFARSLTKTVHLRHPVPVADRPGQVRLVPYHRIPNVAIFMYERRGDGLIMLPSLLGRATDDGTADLTIPEFIQTELAAIIRGAALAVEPGEEGHWGVTLAAERVRQRDGRGHMTFGTCRVKASNVAEFGDRIIEEAQETDWGKDCFFFFKTRGIRGSTTHTKAEQQEALSTLLDQFDLTHFKPKDWFIDVGAEIQSQGDVLWWRRDALWRVVATALAVGEAEAADIVSKARMDAPCQLEDIHGCRIEPSQADARGNNCSYLQMYCTEKHITYQLSSDSNSHQLKASAVVKDYRAAQRFAEAMAICYQDAAKGFDGYARVELRLPLEKALVDILPRDLERVVVAIPRAAWWTFKLVRLRMLSTAIAFWGEGDSATRLSKEALTLVCACIHAINALNSRPKDHAADRALVATILPGLQSRDEAGQRVRRPSQPYGGVMISRIHYEYGRTNVPRLPTGVMLTQHELDMFAGGKGSWDRLISKLSPTAFKRTKLAGRVATKTTVRHIASEVAVDQVVTNAARHGARLGPLPRDEGSDLDMLPSDYEDEEESLDQLLTRIFNQFKIDVMCQIPNPREDSEFVYSELRMSERKNNVDQYMVHERNLAVIFNQVMVRQGDSDSWKAAFRHYFPKERKAQPSSAQGFHTWYKRWMAIRSRLSPRSLQAARTELWLQFRKLRWVPMATSDRLWCSARLTSNYELYPEGATYQIAPRILLNYRFSDWHFTLVRNRLHPAPRHLSAIERANLAQEEEEDSEEEVDMQL